MEAVYKESKNMIRSPINNKKRRRNIEQHNWYNKRNIENRKEIKQG